MPSLQRIEPAAPSFLQRARQVWDAVRSSWSGPLTSSSPELARYFTDAPSHAGVNVSADTALTYPAFWAAVSLIAGDIASLPLILYKRLPNGGKQRFVDHQLYRLLHDEPNPEMTSMVFRETLQGHVLTWGNGYAEIERDQLRRPIALWPLTPNRVRPFRESASPYAPLRYAVLNPAGTEDILDATDILHIPGLGWDGYLGYSVIAKARESLGLGLAMQQFGAGFFGNGSTFGGVFSAPGILPPKNKQDLETNLKNFHQGLDRAHRFVILEGGLTYTKLGVPPDDAQFLESRSFHISEIARWFKLSPHKLSDYSRATFSNIEESNIDHVVTCIRPWLIRWEQELNRKLIAPSERKIQFCEHLVSALLRGNLQSRYAAYAVGRQWGWLSADDILEMENGNPLPDGQGQIYLVPQNMWPSDQIEEMTKAQASKGQPPTAAPAPAEPDPATERALALLEERLTLADATVRQAKADLDLERELRAAVDATVGTTATERDEARHREEVATSAVAHLTLLAEQIRTERDRALVDRDAAIQERQEREQQATERIAVLSDDLSKSKACEAEARTLAAQASQEAERKGQLALQWEQTALADDEARQKAEAAAAYALAEATRAQEALSRTEQARQDAQVAREAAEAQAEALRTDQANAEAELAERHGRLAELERQRTELQAALEHEEGLSSTLRTTHAEEAGRLRSELSRLQADQTLARAAIADAQQRADWLQGQASKVATDEADRRAAVLAAHRDLIIDVMRRMVERETDRARRAQTTPEKLSKWIETFYPGHEELCVTALLPAIRVHVSWMGHGEDAETVTRILVAEHIQESKRQIAAVADGDAEELGISLSHLRERWHRDRVATIADRILQKELGRG